MARLEHKHINIGHVAERLEAAKKVGPTGDIAFEGLASDEATAILTSCIHFSAKIPDRQQQRILHLASFEAGRSGVITPTTLLRALNKLEREYLAQPRQPYILATSISVRTWPWRLPSSVRFDGRTITFSRQLPKRFDRSPLVKTFPDTFRDPDPKDFASVRIRVSARSADEAGEEGFDTLDFLRGIWNFDLNLPTISRFFSSGRPHPVNDIRLGPIHTLHHPSGEIAQKTFWYDPFYTPGEASRIDAGKWNNMIANTATIRRLIAQLSYRARMRDFFIRYARALDTADHEKGFLKLWNLLEDLTDTAAGDTYDKTIRRALFIGRDPEWQSSVLHHLRTYRNASVHSGYSTDRAEKYVYQLKTYVEELILFHLTSRPKFKSIHAMAEYLELPRDPEILRKKIALFERALRFRVKAKPRGQRKKP